MSKANKTIRKHRRLWSAMLISLNGCMVGPDYIPPKIAVPAAWSQSEPPGSESSAKDLATWWTLFNDDALNELVETAISANPERDLSLARVREARARYRISVAEKYPSVSAGGTTSATRSEDFIGKTEWRDLYDANIDASWEVDIFGANRRSVQAAEATIQVREADYVDVMTTLVAEVALSYVDVRTLEKRLLLTQAQLDSQKKTFEIARWRAEAGLTTERDLEQARGDLHVTRATIPTLERDIIQAQNKLAFLLGETPGEFCLPVETSAMIPTMSVKSPIGIPADILRQRSDIRAAERNLAAQCARIGIAEANRYPSFTLGGTIGYSGTSTAILFAPAGLASSVASSVVAPVFNAGRLRSAVEVEDAVFDQAAATYESVVLTALKEVEDLLAAYNSAARRAGILRRGVAAAKRAHRLTMQEYEAGLIGVDRVLDAQRTLLSLEEQHTLNEASETTSIISLYKAIGGGWNAAQAR